MCIFDNITLDLFRVRNCSDKRCREIKRRILHSKTFSENSASYGLLWKNKLQPRRPQTAIYCRKEKLKPIPVAALSKAKVCGRAVAEIVGSNPSGGMDYLSFLSVCVVR
jgi:hypothetical protein